MNFHLDNLWFLQSPFKEIIEITFICLYQYGLIPYLTSNKKIKGFYISMAIKGVLVGFYIGFFMLYLNKVNILTNIPLPIFLPAVSLTILTFCFFSIRRGLLFFGLNKTTK